MKASIALCAAVILACATPAFAQTAACTAPTAPTVPDGASATLADMQSANLAVRQFIADSDVYQQCEVDTLSAQRAAAKEAKAKFDNNLAKATGERIAENQKQKEAVGAAFSAARKAYLAAHPS